MAEHSVVVIECPDCTRINTVTHLEHGRDSVQHKAVCSGHDRLAAEHHEQTGHSADVKRFSGTPGEMCELAFFHAETTDGVDADKFDDLEVPA